MRTRKKTLRKRVYQAKVGTTVLAEFKRLQCCFVWAPHMCRKAWRLNVQKNGEDFLLFIPCKADEHEVVPNTRMRSVVCEWNWDRLSFTCGEKNELFFRHTSNPATLRSYKSRGLVAEHLRLPFRNRFLSIVQSPSRTLVQLTSDFSDMTESI